MAESSEHRWQFARSGGFDQVRLETAEDLAHLGELDLKLWAALACPVKGLEFDERTLALIDADKDGRVRAPEIIAAVRWAAGILKDPADLKAGADSVPLDRIADTEAGRAVLASARQILKDLGKPATAIALADVSDTARLFSQTRLNGDGIVPAEAATDEATRKLLQDLIACVGSVPDRSGLPGIDRARLDAFFAEAAAEVGWAAKADGDTALRPLGEGTAAAHAAWAAVRAKVDDWFARGRMAAFDARALGALNRREEEYLAIAAQDLSVTAQEVAGFPLARVVPGGALPLVDGVNPAWAAGLDALRTAAVEPVLGKGKTALTAADWATLCARLAGHDGWVSARPGTRVAGLGAPRLKEILAGTGQQAVVSLIEADLAREGEYRAIEQVERLVRYHRDLYRLLCNFVNFSDFYSPDRWAIFQAGTLYLDARSSELCVRVDDAGKHALLAGHSKSYLAYMDCTRPSGEKLAIAVGITDGDADYLMAGRNGVFFDRQGRDWDATIARLVENPISVRQAFWTPYKKLVRFLDEVFGKRAAAAEAESDKKLAAAAEEGAAAPPATPGTVPPPAPAAPGKKMDVGTVAAISVAIAGIGALLTTLIGYIAGLFTLPFWILCLALAGILLVISGPSMLIAWLKLRQRNLGPILDANGWAVNGRVKLNVKFGKSLTQIAKLPPGSAPGADPFGEKPSPWPRLLLAALVVAFVYSFLSSHYWLNDWTRPGTWWHERVGFAMGAERPPAAPTPVAPAPAEAAPETKPAGK